MPDDAHSRPGRDRHLASQVRHGPRWSQDAGDLVAHWLNGPEGRRLRRNRKIISALGSVLPAAMLSRVEPVVIRQGSLTLAVADAPLLAELRAIHHSALIAALIEHGTGLSRVQYRLKRSRTAGV